MDHRRHIPTVAIVADDLTGALDSAVAFAGGGRRITVARGVAGIPAALRDSPDVLAVDTGSREASPDAAVAAMEAVGRALSIDEVPILFKKIDSRLKGHVREEVGALRRLSGRNRVIVAPAIPQMGRQQRDGWLFGAGIEAPLAVSDHVEGDAVIPDAEDDAALDRIAGAEDATTLWVGARGLAFALSRARFGTADRLDPDLPGPAIFAIGSRDPITLTQIAVLREACPEMPVMRPADPPNASDPGMAFARDVAARIGTARPATVLMSGGRTAAEILDCLGIETLELSAEIAPGLPLSIATVPWGQIRIVTKSGGFGPPEILKQIAEKVDQR